MKIAGLVVLGCVVLLCGTSNVEARSLAEQIDTLFGERGITVDTQPIGGVRHEAHFSSDSLARLGTLTAQLAASAADFPAVSTVPGFTYRYNSELQVYERSSRDLGSVFIERPLTIGAGKLDVGASYLYADFDQLNGKDIDHLAFRGLKHQDCCAPVTGVPGNPAFEEDTADILFSKFKLTSHVFSVFATYGLTDRWDVNILIPVVHTSLEVRARAILNDISQTDTHFFNRPAQTTRETRSIDDEKTGVGDLKLRTKYNVLDGNPFALAPGLVLSIPTGNDENFQGTGDTTLTPFFVLAKELGIVDLHGSCGIEVNADSLDRSRVRYGAGVAVQVVKQLALNADVIGNSNLERAEITTKVPIFEGTERVRTETRTSNVHTDIVDLAVGFKVNIYGSVVGFFNVFLPLNSDGLRADWIPAAGLEASF